jgi:hypothetical protein
MQSPSERHAPQQNRWADVRFGSGTDIRTGRRFFRRSSTGSLAMFAAIRCARLVASKIIELAQRGVRDAPTLSAMTLKEFKHD